MAQDDSFAIGMIRIRLLDPILQLLCFAEGGFDYEDMINVGSL